MPRHVFSREECRRGGLTRAAQPSMQEARSKGFWATYEKYPFYARRRLRLKIKAQDRARNIRASLAPRAPGRRRPMSPRPMVG